VAALLTMVFLIAYPVMGLLILVVHGVGPGAAGLQRLPVGPDELSGLMLTVGALLLAAMFVTWATQGRPGLVRLGRRVIRWRIGVSWWLVVLLGLPLLTVVSAPQHGVFTAALLSAVPFGFAHWPLALLGDVSITSAPVGLGLFLVLGPLVRPLFGLVLRGSRDSVLGVALMHSIFNRITNQDGISARLLTGDGYQIGVLVALVVLTTVLALVLRARLSPATRRQFDGTTPPAADRPDTPATTKL
jgi:hypothetical protein